MVDIQVTGFDWIALLKTIVFLWGYVINFLTENFMKIGMNSRQTISLLLIVALAGLYVAIKLGQTIKPLIKILILILIGWFILGFFSPV